MPKLIIENGPDRGKSCFINAEEPFFIGRDKAAQVPLQDEMISRRHCQVELQNGTFHIRDLGSSNGTLLNGRVIKGLQPLTSNDRIQVGDTSITFIDENKPSLIGQEISGYRILDRIGRGGMGTVYRVLQTSLDREVALKILAPHLTSNTSFVNLFIREARAAGALSHPNIVQVYDVGVHQDTYFFSMEFIPNGSVEDLLNLGGALPLERALRIVRDAAHGLEYAEQKGIIHRDIKPGNLMVGANGVIKIGDLGIARSTEGEGSISQKDGVSGSPHYIAPEQARGLDIDHRVDIYSLGVSFYQMLCGKTPFGGATPREVILKHLKDEPPRLTERVPDLPVDVARLVSRMMAKQRDQRPLSATALLEDLKPLVARFPEDETAITVVPRARRLLPYWLLAGAVLFAAGIIGFVQWQRHRSEQANEMTNRIEAGDDLLRAIEKEIDGSNLNSARALFDQIGADQLVTADQSEWRSRLEQKWRDHDDRRRLEERRSVALEALDAAKKQAEEVAELSPEVGIIERAPVVTSLLERIASDHAEFEAVREEAGKLAEALKTRASKVEERRRQAQRAFNAARINAAEHARDRHYELAHEALTGLPADVSSETFDPDLAREWKGAMEALLSSVRAYWEDVSGNAQQMMNEHKYFDAKAALSQFERRIADFPTVLEEVEKLRSRIVELESTRKQPQSEAQDSRVVLHNSMRSALHALAANPAVPVRNLVRDLAATCKSAQLTAEDRSRCERLQEILHGWPVVLQELLAATPPRGGSVTIQKGGATKSFEIVRIERDKIYFREAGASAESFLRWDEISAAESARVLGRCVRTDRHRLYCGLLARVAGIAEEGEAHWRGIAAGSVEASAAKDLRELLELMGDAQGN